MITSGTNVNKYLGHGLSNPLVNFYLGHGGKSKLMSLPICPKCERAGLRDKGWALSRIMCCPHCGYRGPTTHQLSAYIKEGLYR